jgi:hypothetical protein
MHRFLAESIGIKASQAFLWNSIAIIIGLNSRSAHPSSQPVLFGWFFDRLLEVLQRHLPTRWRNRRRPWCQAQVIQYLLNRIALQCGRDDF